MIFPMICLILIWNIRGVRNTSSWESLKRLAHSYKPLLLAISEPMLVARKALKLGRYIKLPNYTINSSNDSKIWVFWHDQYNLEVISSSAQQITLGFKTGNDFTPYFSFVYASCVSRLRLDVFNELLSFVASISIPWLLVEILTV